MYKLTCEAHEEICNVEDVSWVARGEVVHLVGLSRLIGHDIEQNVNGCICIVRCRAVPKCRTVTFIGE